LAIGRLKSRTTPLAPEILIFLAHPDERIEAAVTSVWTGTEFSLGGGASGNDRAGEEVGEADGQDTGRAEEASLEIKLLASEIATFPTCPDECIEAAVTSVWTATEFSLDGGASGNDRAREEVGEADGWNTGRAE
jgi:hypothetical protein